MVPNLVMKSIVRVKDVDGKVVGVGFHISRKKIITCAHVLKQAINLELTSSNFKGKVVNFDFLGAKNKLKEFLPGEAEIIFLDNQLDIACLELTNFPPDGVSVPPIDFSVKQDNIFGAIGFPVTKNDGIGVDGKIKGRDGLGLIQLEVTSVYNIEPGFSGGPIWDQEESKVVGVVSKADLRPDKNAAWMIPFDLIQSVWSEFESESVQVEKVEIPVVVIAMNDVEAKELLEENSFPSDLRIDNELLPFYKDFMLLKSDGLIENWIEKYDKKRDRWIPYGFEKSIYEVTFNVVSEINRINRSTGDNEIMYPVFYSENFFSSNGRVSADTWEILDEKGCLVLIDIVSMLHPNILKRFWKSEIGKFPMSGTPKKIIHTLFPTLVNNIGVLKVFENFVSEAIPKTYNSYLGFKEHCEFDFYSVHTLKRRLFFSIPEMVSTSSYKEPLQENMDIFEAENSIVVHGIGRKITGRR